MINKCIEFIQAYLLPQSCLLCSHPTHRSIAICPACEDDLPLNKMRCQCCAVPLQTSDPVLCAGCQLHPPAFHNSHIPLLYSEPVSQWIWHFKFRNDLVKGKAMADLFCESLNVEMINNVDALIPVPLHPSRIRQRGYNQALWLARQISRQTGIKVDCTLVKRVRKTAAQHDLKYKQRLTNLKGAFEIQNQCSYKSVAIIDDVVTTGTTVNEIARLLAGNGVESIQVWAIARTAPGN